MFDSRCVQHEQLSKNSWRYSLVIFRTFNLYNFTQPFINDLNNKTDFVPSQKKIECKELITNSNYDVDDERCIMYSEGQQLHYYFVNKPIHSCARYNILFFDV